MELALFTNKKNKRGNYKELKSSSYKRQNIKLDLVDNTIANTENIKFSEHEGKTVKVLGVRLYDDNNIKYNVLLDRPVVLKDGMILTFMRGYITLS